LEFLSTDTQTIIFVIRQDWEEREIQDNEPLVFEATVTQADIIQCVADIRGLYRKWQEQNYSHDSLNQIDLAKQTSFYAIGNALFSKALMEAIEGYDLIYFVPFSALHHLPLHAMRFEGIELIERFACSYLPSASVLQFTNQDNHRASAYSIKAVGVDFKGEWKEFAKEARDVAQAPFWQDSQYFIQSNATKANFFANNDPYNILHCSTHGYFDQDDPMRSGIHLHEGIVSVHDLITHLKNPFELVFFSACVSGENKNEAGDELIGLSRGLFYSGSKAMILSLFNTMKNVTVDSEVHIKHFYQEWIAETQPKAKAFQHYIQKLKANKRYNHPFYWFAYILIGNPY
jgi:CHAT domain-containing protein